MRILVLNGSPRAHGNTAQMVAAFKEGAASAGHKVDVVDVCKLDIHGCRGCEYCHGKGAGACVQKDDMQQVYDLLAQTEMLVIASPIYYHGLSGQIKCAIDRFYAAAYPEKPAHLSKVAMILCSGDPDMYTGALFSYEGDFTGYLGLEGMGVLTVHGDVTAADLGKARSLGESL